VDSDGSSGDADADDRVREKD